MQLSRVFGGIYSFHNFLNFSRYLKVGWIQPQDALTQIKGKFRVNKAELKNYFSYKNATPTDPAPAGIALNHNRFERRNGMADRGRS